MPRRLLTLVLLLVTALAAGAARAQVVGTLGAGTGRITYDDTPRLTVVSLTPAGLFEGERTTVSGMASFTRFDGGIWSAQAVAAGSRFTEARGPFRGELSAQAEMNSHRGTLRTAQAIAQGRGHLVGGGDRGVWLGAGAGHAWRSPAGGGLLRADVGGREERTNLEVVEAICDALDARVPLERGRPRRELITFVTDRPGHDRRYAIDSSKIERELGWHARESFASGLARTIDWYLENRWWWEPIRSGKYAGERLGSAA